MYNQTPEVLKVQVSLKRWQTVNESNKAEVKIKARREATNQNNKTNKTNSSKTSKDKREPNRETSNQRQDKENEKQTRPI